MVEFALVAPIFFLLLFGVMEMGRLVWINHELTNGTREGARFAMVRGSEWAKTNTPVTDRQIEDQILARTSGLSDSNLAVTTAGRGGNPGTTLTVTSSYQYDVFVGIIPGLSDFTLTRTSKVIIQH